jgi:hypothetical protein
MATAYYVYEHRRKDTGAVFYVGKGSGPRARCTHGRNRHWRNVASKAGWSMRIAFRTDDEELAFLAEQELIRRHRMLGSQLVNMTDGGEGLAGFKFPAEVIERRSESQRGQKRPTVSEKLRGRQKSSEHRANLAASHRGKKPSAETRARMSAAQKGHAPWNGGKRLTSEHRAAISSGITGERNPFYGRRHSNETIRRLSEANLGFKHSNETKRLMSDSRRGEANPRHGVSIPEDQKARQIASLKARPLMTCPHCGKRANEGNARRWHFDRCRSAT